MSEPMSDFGERVFCAGLLNAFFVQIYRMRFSCGLAGKATGSHRTGTKTPAAILAVKSCSLKRVSRDAKGIQGEPMRQYASGIMANTLKLTPEKLTAFCAALAETAQVTKACAAVSISSTTAYQWRKEHLDFALAWDEAKALSITVLEDEVIRRGCEGFDDPIVHQGQFIPLIDYEAIDPLTDEKYIPALAPVKRNPDGSPHFATVKKYSDTLLIFTLKAHDPKYRDKQNIELTGKDGAAIQFNDTEKATRIATLMAVAAARQTPSDDCSDLV